MRKLGVLLAVGATLMVAYVPLAMAARERAPATIESESLDDPNSLASPNYRGYRPAWANPYAEPPYVGVNDDPTPFDPADVDSGPSPFQFDD